MVEAVPDTAVKRPLALRALFWFWGLVLLAAVGGGVTLQVLGPPPHGAPPAAPQAAADHPAVPPSAAEPPHAPTADEPSARAALPPEAAPAPVISGPPSPRVAGAPIPPPDPALLEAMASDPKALLPRIGADGRTPMLAYAAGFDATDTRPGSRSCSAASGSPKPTRTRRCAVLPAPVSFAVSPYTLRPDRLLGEIRAAGHEMLIGIPMEPQGYPVNDEGNQALLTGSATEQNEQRLGWTLSRIAGYVGATNALDGLRGERYSAASTQMEIVLKQLSERGLMYIDASPASSRLPLGTVGRIVTRGIDVIIDEPAVRSEIDLKLQQLEQLARDRGSALGLAGLPRPITLGRLAAWANTLGQRGFALAPVSIVARMPLSTGPTPSVQAEPYPMTLDPTALPYRPNVGAALFNRAGRLFVARRADLPNAEGAPGGWQLPQGGIDEHEDPRSAVLRELAEEIGTDRAEIIGEHPEWLTLRPSARAAWQGTRRAVPGPAPEMVRAPLPRHRRGHPARPRSPSRVRRVALGGAIGIAGYGGGLQTRDL